MSDDIANREITLTVRALDTICWLSTKFGTPDSWAVKDHQVIWFLEDPENEAPDYVELRYGAGRLEVDIMVHCDHALVVIGYCAREGIAFRLPEQILAAWEAEDAAKEGSKGRVVN